MEEKAENNGEEIVVTVVEEENCQKNPAFSDEEMDAMREQLKLILQKQNYTSSKKSEQLAKSMAINSKDYLDNDTYLWVMYAYALQYQKNNNGNGENFCYLKMRDVLEAEQGRRKKMAALTFKENTLPEHVNLKVQEKTKFMDEELHRIKKKFFALELGMIAVVALIMVIVFQYSIMMAFAIAMIAGVANILFSYHNLLKKYQNEQIRAIKPYCDEELIQFDYPVSVS